VENAQELYLPQVHNKSSIILSHFCSLFILTNPGPPARMLPPPPPHLGADRTPLGDLDVNVNNHQTELHQMMLQRTAKKVLSQPKESASAASAILSGIGRNIYVHMVINKKDTSDAATILGVSARHFPENMLCDGLYCSTAT
jgi:hypothetical protein